MRWHYRDPLLVWLLPGAYVCHLLEEWFGGLPEWMSVVLGSPLPRPAFIAINTVAFLLMVVGIRATTRRESNGWMGIAVATILLVNGVAHLLGSVVTGTYAPGLVTGVVLYLPLGSLVLLRARGQAEGDLFARGVLAGIGLHALAIVIAYASAVWRR